ncbi:MAG: MobF family relaxase [Acidimicrobiales bacterium]
MMTIRRLSVGSGYKYLLKSIAASDGPESVDTSDLVRYYAETGTPPGVFLGAGLAGLDGGRGIKVSHSVSAENLQRMLQDCADPITGEVLGRAPSAKAVGGFDLTFSPSKSVSVAWALGDRATRDVIYQCHQQAIANVLAYAEREVFKTRSGHRGCVEEEIVGVVAASFTHFDSRDADPQLHDHVVVLNRVQATSDGLWRTLDSRGLFGSAVMLSEMHQGVLSDLLTEQLGWDWDPHARRSSPVAKWEVAGVSTSLMQEFSRRTADIIAAKDRLIERFATDHSRAPTDVEVLKLRQTATLATRHAKQSRSLVELTNDWTTRALPYFDDEPASWVYELGQKNVAVFSSHDFGDNILRDVANASLDVVSAKRPTFSRANVLAEVFRQLQSVRFVEPAERLHAATRATDLALAQALLINAPSLHHTPRFLLRSDGTSKFETTGHWRYTTTTLLDAEARLLASGQRTDTALVSRKTVVAVAGRPLPCTTFTLSLDQARCASEITTSGRALDVLVGAAGTGKSTAMAGLRAAWEREHGPDSVLGLAPSAAAAEVLGDDMGIDADNLAKWLYEHRQRGQRTRELQGLRHRVRQNRAEGRGTSQLRERISRLEGDLHRWRLRAGQLVVVDEASLASTFALDELMSAALDAGAKVVLAGDPAQLSSVDAGGMFRTLVFDRGEHAPTLEYVRRFTAAWEKRASLQVRRGEATALSGYDAHERITEGPRDDVLDALYAAWQRDTDQGLHSLMLAGDATTVDELNARARADRVERGLVNAGVVIGTLAVGVNDLVVTRENERRLRTSRSWVKNGDEWRVVATHEDGALSVERVRGGEPVLLPARYVAQHVELAYASTVHRAQGRTVDTAHAFVSPTTTREVLYVALTRGSEANHLYVDTHYDPDPDTGHEKLTKAPSALEVLTEVLRREGADRSATDVIRDSQATSVAALVAEYNTIVTLADGERWESVFRDAGLDDAEIARAQNSDAYRTLLGQLREAEVRGFDVRGDLLSLVKVRPFEDAGDVAATLTRRVTRYVAAMGYPELNSSQLVAGLFPRATCISDPDVLVALNDRADAIDERAQELAVEFIDRSCAWVRKFGDVPPVSAAYEQWIKEVAVGAAYLEMWGNEDFSIVSNLDMGPQQQVQHGRVLRAMERVRTLGQESDSDTFLNIGPRISESFEPQILDFSAEI